MLQKNHADNRSAMQERGRFVRMYVQYILMLMATKAAIGDIHVNAEVVLGIIIKMG